MAEPGPLLSWMALYGTSADAAAASSSPRDSSSSRHNTISSSAISSSAITVAPDDDDAALDDARQRLLGDHDHDRNTMTLLEVLYAYDLTLAQLTFQKFGRNRGARIAWECLSQSGDGILWFLMVLPVVTIMYFLGLLADASLASKTVFIAFYTCNFVDIVMIIIMKLLFKRARPPHHHNDGRFVGPDQHSFPSGHATRCWCIVSFVVDLANRHPAIAGEFFRVSPDLLRVLIVVWALAISFSRIALGRHYPSDVFAGACVGVFGLYPIARFVIRNFTSLSGF